jgi:glycosyltransferase involved in cell wall biosynthesis
MTRTNNVSVFVFTLDEEENLPSCLDSLQWTDDVVVIDSYSTDSTLQICAQRDVRVYRHRFNGFGSQRNWALDNIERKYPWVLILDADEKIPNELANEILVRISQNDLEVCAYRLKRKFFLWGKWLKYSSLYPTWVVRLIQGDKVHYVNRGHAETQIVDGKIDVLENDIIDENRKEIDAWFDRQNDYSRREAEYEIDQQKKPFHFSNIFSHDPVLRRAALKRLTWALPGRAVWYFLYSYIWRRGFLDGKEGLTYCLMRSMYQEMIAIKKYDLAKKAEKL